MKCGFFHDTFIYSTEDGKYYSINFSYDIWKRYLNVSNELLVVTRQKNIEKTDKNKLVLSSGRNVSFFGMENISSPLGVKNIPRVKRNIKKIVQKIDFAIVRLPSFIGQFALEECKTQGKPYLIELVGCPWDALWNHSFKGKIIAPYMYYKTKKNVKFGKYVIYVTNEFLQKRYPTNGRSISCSNVVLKDFDDNVLQRRLSKIQNKTSAKIIIGTTAAVDVRYKGQQNVIKALGKLKRLGMTHFEYQLVGGGDNTYLKRIAEKYNVIEKVKFLGPKPHDEVFEWLETIDIYVQPSKQEGLPRALIEAMSKGVPAFGAKTGGIPELLDNECIFSNSRKNIDEIISILMKISTKRMLQQAERNYNEGKKYNAKDIEERRQNFLKEFVQYSDIEGARE